MKSRPTAAASPAISCAAGLGLVEPVAQDGGQVPRRERSPAHRAHRLDDEQRKAAGDRGQQAALRVRERTAAQRLGQLRGVHRVERPERELGQQARRPQVGDPVGQPGVVRSAVVAQGRREQHGSARQQAQAEGEEGQGLLVAPLHVVEHQQHRTADTQQGPGQPLEEAVPLPRVRECPARGVTTRGGNQPVDLQAPDRVEPAERRLHVGAAQPLRDRGQREPAGGGEALRRRDHGPRAAGRLGDLGDEPALADARAAPDHHDAGPPGRGRPPGRPQDPDLLDPADEGHGTRRRGLRRGRAGEQPAQDGVRGLGPARPPAHAPGPRRSGGRWRARPPGRRGRPAAPSGRGSRPPPAAAAGSGAGRRPARRRRHRGGHASCTPVRTSGRSAPGVAHAPPAPSRRRRPAAGHPGRRRVPRRRGRARPRRPRRRRGPRRSPGRTPAGRRAPHRRRASTGRAPSP